VPRGPRYQQSSNFTPHQGSSHAQVGHSSLGWPSQGYNGHVPGVPPVISVPVNDYQRPAIPQGRLYSPGMNLPFGTAEQQRASRHRIMEQSDYLNTVAKDAHEKHRLKQDELLAKESFRRELERFVRSSITAVYPDYEPDGIKLKCYGSLANGFGLAGCDMDLLLVLPAPIQQPADTAVPGGGDLAQTMENAGDDGDEHGFQAEARRVIEKAMLDHGYGARLLTKTRVPILRVCERPTAALLQNLRDDRRAWEQSLIEEAVDITPDVQPPILTPAEIEAATKGFAELNVAEIPLPASPPRGQSSLEYSEDCGIQCDINFGNFVALYNTRLLRTYHKYDSRVGEIGVFVKTWAKARDINTPYHGTLSSYGYILMVLHYLMNVVDPPVIPNLQFLARDSDAWNNRTNIELFEGFDVRFLSDEQRISEVRAAMPRNHESTGHLLRGFFWYYADRAGFHWNNDVISIRTKGGLVTKRSKGWTEAKWDQTQNVNVRLRYLLAIEDPFEIEHNVGRTVGHTGIVAIRDEFRRAWAIIQRIGSGVDAPPSEFLQPVENRGDTLKKDREFHQQKLRQLRQDLEAKELALRNRAIEESAESEANGTSASTSHQRRPSGTGHGRLSGVKLMRTGAFQGTPRQSRDSRRRKVKDESEGEEDEMQNDGGDTVDQQEEGDDDGDGDDQDKGDEERHSSDTRSRVQHDNANDKDPLPNFFPVDEIRLAKGFNAWGEPVAWDDSTREGRWLRWRDRKIRDGSWQSLLLKRRFRKLHHQCPYDPRRPVSPGVNPVTTNFVDVWPPYPMPNGKPESIDAASLDGSKPSRDFSRPSTSDHSVDNDKIIPTPPGPTEAPENLRRPVGNPIPWDLSTVGGRWLRRRDRRIRDGVWRSIGQANQGYYIKLHQRFPYNPVMTYQELEVCNQELRTFYSRTIWRDETAKPRIHRSEQKPQTRPDKEMPLPVDETECNMPQDPAGLVSGGPNSRPDRPIPRDISPHRQLPGRTEPIWSGPFHTSTEHVKKASDEAADKPDLEFIRRQRLAFFASRTKSEASGKTSNGLLPPDVQTVHTLMKKAGMESQVHDDGDWYWSRSGIWESSPQGFPQYVSQPQRSPDPTTESNQWPDTASPGESRNERSADVASVNSGDSGTKAPLTLCLKPDHDHRPKDEDSKTMPVPSSLGFQFDPRQLQDIAIIRRGGNGCARVGAEFDIQVESEWQEADTSPAPPSDHQPGES